MAKELVITRRVTKDGDLSYRFPKESPHGLPEALFLMTGRGVVGLKKQRQHLNLKFANQSQMNFIGNLFSSGVVFMLTITKDEVVATVNPDLSNGDIDKIMSTQFELLTGDDCQIKPSGEWARSIANVIEGLNGLKVVRLCEIPVLA